MALETNAPATKRRVLIIDQFSGISPFWLQHNPTQFEDLIKIVQADEAISKPFRYSRVEEVDTSYRPDWATLVIAADDDGRAFVWKSRVDSSG